MSKSQAVAVESTGLNIVKRPKTVLKSGLTYSLVSRVFNALPYEDRVRISNLKSGQVDFVDGRGADRQMHQDVITLSEKLGAKFIASVRSSFLRARMNIDWKALTVELKELEKPEAKEDTSSAEALAKSTAKTKAS